MIPFLLEEGVLTFGALSGMFTASLLTSLKSNIIDPMADHVAPHHILDKHTKSEFNSGKKNVLKKLKWQTFLKDFITWLIVVIVFYLIYNFFIKPHKKIIN